MRAELHPRRAAGAGCAPCPRCQYRRAAAILRGMSIQYPIPRGTREVTLTTTVGQTVFGPFEFLLYDPADIEPWGSFGDPLENKPYIQKQQLRTWKVEDWTWSDWQPVVARYLGEISLLDAQVGRLLAEFGSFGAHLRQVENRLDAGERGIELLQLVMRVNGRHKV